MSVAEARRAPSKSTKEGPVAAADKKQDDLLKLDLPLVSFQVHRPHVHLPQLGRAQAREAVRAARSILPPPERVAYYGGLGALAVFGVIEWPVAAAIGAGTLVAQRARAAAKKPPAPASAAQPQADRGKPSA